MLVPEEDQTSDRNMTEGQGVYNTLSHTYVHFDIISTTSTIFPARISQHKMHT